MPVGFGKTEQLQEGKFYRPGICRQMLLNPLRRATVLKLVDSYRRNVNAVGGRVYAVAGENRG